MSSIWLRKFRGLDARRLPETAPSDSLIRGLDGRIARGGEFEKRAAFVPTYDLPFRATVGLAATSTSLYVFGDQPAAAITELPDGFTYQQLPTASPPQGRIVSWDLFSDKLYVAAETVAGVEHYYDGTAVGRSGRFASVTARVAGGAPGDTIDVLIGGISVTGGPVVLGGSADSGSVVVAINTATSSPDYNAFDFSDFDPGLFAIFAVDVGAAPNGRVVHFVTTGTVTVADGVLSGGGDAYATETRFVRTIGTKEYTLSGSDLQFSSIGDPADWTGGDGGTGYGFIDTSSYTAGSEDLTAIVEFRGTAAVFSQRTVQLWRLAADPADDAIQQVLRNTGTSCPLSVTQFGDGDLFYLAENGLRSLRARDSSNKASTYGVAVRVDPLITAKLRSLTEDERARVIGLIEPVTGNFWLIMKDTIFVYSFFLEEGVKAWTYYTTHRFDEAGNRVDFEVEDAVVFDRRVYLRSGDTIFVYGGLETGQATDATEAEAWTAYLDDGDPTAEKDWTSFDAAVSGEWQISAGMSLADTDVADTIGTVARTTYNDERIGVVGRSTHISLRFKSVGTGPATLGACAVHYEPVGDAPEEPAIDPGAWSPYWPYGTDLATAKVWYRPD